METRIIIKNNMKAIFMAMLTLSCGLASCDSDAVRVVQDVEGTTEKKATGGPEVRTGFDDLAIFENSILETDASGKVVDFFYGEQLDAKNPRHLFIGVDNMEEAEKMFHIWFAPDVEVQRNGTRLTAMLTDKQGRDQGAVHLSAGTEDNHVAEVTFSSDIHLEHFDRITFLKNTAWPTKLRDTQKRYSKFDIVKDINFKDISNDVDDEDSKLNIVCIQSSGNGVKPIFCALTNHKYGNPISNKYIKNIRQSRYCPGEVSAPTAFTIQRILKADWDGFVETFKEAGSGSLVAGANYWYDESHYTFIFEYNGVMDYRRGSTYGEDSFDKYYQFLLRVFNLDEDAIYDGASV